MTELTFSQAQLIDPLLNLDAGQHDFPAIEGGRSLDSLKIGARIMVSLGLTFGALAGESFLGADIAHAEHDCYPGDPNPRTGNVRQFIDADGELNIIPQCADGPPPTPTTAKPPTGGGNGGGGNTGGGNTGTQPASPPEPSFEDVLAFYQCSDVAGVPAFALELKALKGADGSDRLATVIEDCPLDYYEETGILPDYGRPNTNWEDIIKNEYANVTPNAAQTQAVNVYLKAEWDRLNAPATTVASETTTTTIVEVETTDITEVTADTEPATTTTVLRVETTDANLPETTESEITTPIGDNSGGSGGSSFGNKLAKTGVAVLSALGLGALVIFLRRRRVHHEPQKPPHTFGGSPVAGH